VATDALRGRVRQRAAAGGPAEAEAFRLLAADTALGRIATAGEVVRTAVFLASDMASGITGQLIRIDAGLR